jgi:hypothetical protein
MFWRRIATNVLQFAAKTIYPELCNSVINNNKIKQCH